MKRFKRVFAGGLSLREIRQLRKMMAMIVLPIMVFYMTSANFLVLEMMKAQAQEDVQAEEVVKKLETETEEVKEEEVEAKEEDPEKEPEEKVDDSVVEEEEEAVTDEPEKVDKEEVVQEPVLDEAGASTQEAVEEGVIEKSVNTEGVEKEDDSLNQTQEKVDKSDEKTEQEVVAVDWERSDDGKVASIGPVELNKKYQAPQNEEVTVTFTKLPGNPGRLTIEEISLTTEQVAQLGALSDKAYDITSDMENGSFEYDLSLPKPAGVSEVVVKYAEKEEDLDQVKQVEKIKIKDDKVEAEDLNHFTIFVVVGDISGNTATPFDESSAYVLINEFAYNLSSDEEWVELYNRHDQIIIIDNWQLCELSGSGSETCHTIAENSIASESFLVKDLSGLNNNGGDSIILKDKNGVVLDKVSYKILGSGATVNGAHDLGDVPDGTETIARTEDGGSDWEVADSTKGASNENVEENEEDTDIYVDVANDSGNEDGSEAHPFNTIQEGIDAAYAGDTIYVAGGTYEEGLSIDKSLTILGPNADISPNTETRENEAVIMPHNNTAITGAAADISVLIKGFSVDMSDTEEDDRFVYQAGKAETEWTFEKNIFKNAKEATAGNWYLTGNAGLKVNIYDNYFTGNEVSNGIALWSTNPVIVDITDNVWENNDYTALNLNDAQGVISRNTFKETRVIEPDFEWWQYQSGMLFSNANFDLEISNNIFSRVYYGISMYQDTGGVIDIFGNTFDGTRLHSFRASDGEAGNQGSANLNGVEISSNRFINYAGEDVEISNARTDNQVVDVQNNWWGNANFGEIASKFDDQVDFNPWCTNAECTEFSDAPYTETETEIIGETSNGDITLSGLTIKDPVTEEGSGDGKIFLAKYGSGEQPGGLSDGVDGFYYDIQYSGNLKFPVSIEIAYDNDFDEDNFESLYYYDEEAGQWRDYRDDDSASTITIDKTANIISASLMHLTPIAVTAADTDAPSQPTGIVIYKGHNSDSANQISANGYTNNTQIRIAWNANSESDVEYYWLGTKTKDHHKKVYGTHYDANMTPGKNPYYYKISAVDTSGNESAVATSYQIWLDTDAPDKLAITTPSAEQYFNSTPIRNEWSVGKDNGVSGVDHYRIEYVYDDGHTFSGAPYRTTTSIWRNHTPGISEQGGVTIRVQAIDKAGNEGEWSDPVHYYYDATAPAAPTLVSPSNGAVVLGASLTSEWSEVSDATKYIYQSYHNATATNVRWTQEVTSTSKTATNVAEATFWWRVKAVDAAGNESPWSDLWQVTVDNTAPTATIDGLAPTSLYGSGTNISVHAIDNNYLQTDLYRAGGATSFKIYTGASFGLFWLADGDYRMVVIDKAGNSTEYEFTVDRSAPVVTLTAPTADYVSGTVAIEGTVTDAHPHHYYLVVKNSAGKVITGPGTVNDSNNFSGKFFDWDTTRVVEGQYTIYLAARDAADNRDDKVSLATKIVTVDNTVPSSTIDGAEDEETVYENAWDGVITGTASDAGSGVASVELAIARGSDGKYWDGADWQDGERFVIANGTTVWDYDLGDPAEDAYTIESHAIDNAGNRENTYTIKIVYDKTIPEVTLAINPANPDGDHNWYDSTPKITLTASDNTTLDKIEYQFDSQTGTWITYAEAVSVGDGERTFYYRSLDKAGNYSAVGKKTVKVDTNAPDEVDDLDAEYKKDKELVKLTWDVDDDDVAEVKIYRGGSRGFDVNNSSLVGRQDADDETFNDDDVTIGKKYYYKVASYDDAGNGSDKVEVVSVEIPTDGSDAVVIYEGSDTNPQAQTGGTGGGEDVAGVATGEEAGNDQGDGETGASLPTDNQDNQDDGQETVLGESTENSGDGRPAWQWILLVFALAGGAYSIHRYFNAKKSF